jgi:hypothetical protein
MAATTGTHAAAPTRPAGLTKGKRRWGYAVWAFAGGGIAVPDRLVGEPVPDHESGRVRAFHHVCGRGRLSAVLGPGERPGPTPQWANFHDRQ